MKKIFTIISFLILFSTSCTDKDDNTSLTIPNNDIKPNQVEMYDYNTPGNIITGTFNYDGNKLNRLVFSNNREDRYVYTNDLITRIDYYQAGVLTNYKTFMYNSSNKLIEYKTYSVSSGLSSLNNTEIFTYNLDGISINSQRIEGSNSQYYKYYLDGNNNINKLESYTNSSYTTVTFTELMTFDTKKTPYMNIVGIDKIMIIFHESQGVNNNLLSHNLSNEIYEIDYNAENFPLKIMKKHSISNQYSNVNEFIY